MGWIHLAPPTVINSGFNDFLFIRCLTLCFWTFSSTFSELKIFPLLGFEGLTETTVCPFVHQTPHPPPETTENAET